MSKPAIMQISDTLYSVGQRLDATVYDNWNHKYGTMVHGRVTRCLETANFGWVVIKRDAGGIVTLKD